MPLPALVLAAGSSTRLRPFTDHLPKSLLPVAGVSMLERSIRHLAAAGVSELVIVTGFQASKLRAAVRAWFPELDIEFVDNPDFATTNNAYSLMLAADAIAARRFVLLDSDLVYDGAILGGLLGRADSCLALRRADDLGVEEVKVAMDQGGRVLGIGKEVALDQSAGESIGIEVFDAAASGHLFATLAHRMGRLGLVGEYYEASFQQMIEEGARMTAVDIAPHRAMEVDTPEDLELAEEVFGATDGMLLPPAIAAAGRRRQPVF